MSIEAQDAGEESRYQAIGSVELSREGAAALLIRALYDPSWRVRRRAAERISGLPDRAHVVRQLLHVLGDRGETGARNAAAEALVQLGPVAHDALFDLLRHPDPDQRKFAADILGQMRHPAAEAPLLAALSDEDANVRVSAAEALGLVGGASSSAALERALAHPDALLRLAALEALGRLGVAPPLPVLVALAKEPALKAAATRLLGLVRQTVALEELARALGHGHPQVREAALAGLGLQLDGADGRWSADLARHVRDVIELDAALPAALAEALESESAEVRAGALFALSLTRDASFAREVAQAASDERVAERVVEALVRMGPQTARALAAELETLSAPARQAAVESLVHLAEPALVPTLEELTEKEDAEVRVLAVRALGRSQSAAALPRLAALLQDAELGAAAARAMMELGRSFPAEVRTALGVTLQKRLSPGGVRVLGAVAKADALPLLRQAAKDPDPRLRAAAAEASGDVGNAAAELLRALLADESLPVRTAAVRAVARLTPQDAVPLLKLALSDEEPQLRIAAVDAVASAALAELSNHVALLLRDPDGAVASRAVKALARVGNFDENALRTAVAHADPEVVREALGASAALPEGVGLARELLRHPAWDLRLAAARVLAASGWREVLTDVEQALANETDPLVREALEQARALVARR